ncbi:MAG: carboxypeptidase regulatory-like domain-containing protein [Bacteroidetes bacterium]|nr:carboxypeptidase regulatory-like domain-containing protein [Bacteroidota bacterium]
MKKVIIYSSLLFFIAAFACIKKTKQRPTTLYISGIVTDKQTSAPLDSVKISLYRSHFGALYLNDYYSTQNGRYNFSFTPCDSCFTSYYLEFTKKGYNTVRDQHIDLDKEYQEFNIAMEKRPTTLYISGIVTDKQTSAPLDSVKISLYRGYYGNGYDSDYYTTSNGKYSFSLTPTSSTSYYLNFIKKGYNMISNRAVDLNKEYQEFNIAMDK